ncbi:conserved hypothetical protein [Hyella patelloides LEGE 07179]|uniref:Leucine-rich repeat domain-containing protein n=1 Tax=Hyella patelloides LEGE 07179 TaxID=945734 RepID=A0A563VZ16_9CYAN|nr:leucine-rich repeat domain-containing protein [Hyella patelloides]VEP16666.1 conserved hypothetical protein [Hyella patelloides LEGE 07179]
MPKELCKCFNQESRKHGSLSKIHSDKQDTQCESWLRLLDLIESAAQTGVEEFAPLREFTIEERSEIVTLPPTIAKLKNVKNLSLYGSCLVRIPPEIGEMESLETFTPYTSYLLHWFPYEIIRCTKLKSSTVSTRAIYGNYKYRPPFPNLKQHINAEAYSLITPQECSVCRTKLEPSKIIRRWISLPVATDVLPLLVHACSVNCINSLPETPKGYVSGSHTGGHDIKQPPPMGI